MSAHESALSKVQRKLASMEARCERLEIQLKDERAIGSELVFQLELLSIIENLVNRIDAKLIGQEQKLFCQNGVRNIRSELKQIRHVARQKLSALYEPIQDAQG